MRVHPPAVEVHWLCSSKGMRCGERDNPQAEQGDEQLKTSANPVNVC